MTSGNIIEYLIPDFPLLQQLDNQLHPWGSCNMTALAACLRFYDKKVTPNRGYTQPEDALLAICDAEGLSRHEPGTIKLLAERFGLIDNLVMTSTWLSTGNAIYQQVVPHLAALKPCIVHGYFTESGHIVCVDGIRLNPVTGKATQWHISDPYGEYYADGYRKNFGNGDPTGRYWLSHEAFTETALEGGSLWIHLIENRDGTTATAI